MMLSKLVRVRVINQANKSAGNKSGVCAVLSGDKSRHTLDFYSRNFSRMTLSKLVKVRVMNQSNKSAWNKSGVYAVLGLGGGIKADVHSTFL